MLEFIFKIVDSFFNVLSLCVITFETGSANIFNSISEKVVKVLVSDKVPNLNASTGVVGGLFDVVSHFVVGALHL